jgi:hypothetical protein
MLHHGSFPGSFAATDQSLAVSQVNVRVRPFTELGFCRLPSDSPPVSTAIPIASSISEPMLPGAVTAQLASHEGASKIVEVKTDVRCCTGYQCASSPRFAAS